MNEEEKVAAVAEEKATEKVSRAETESAPASEESMATLLHDENAPVITMKKLLEAGVHFGHPTRKWNPKMNKYIYGSRNGIYIIDLVKTVAKIEEAYKALKEIVDENGKVLFVGLKPQAKAVVEEQAIRSGSFYITNRWLGGTLTNFKTIQTRIRRLKELEAYEVDGTYDRIPKKEVIQLRKEKEKLSKNLEGIKEMRKIPNALIVVDPKIEHIAIKEAKTLGIPVFGISDTNSDPEDLTYVIPGNDDAARSIRVIITVLADAIVESKGGITEVAYIKDEGEEATMSDAIRQADAENAARIAAIRAARKEKQERFEKIQAQREALRLQKIREAKGEDGAQEAKKEEAPKAPKQPKAKKAKAPAQEAEAPKEEAKPAEGEQK